MAEMCNPRAMRDPALDCPRMNEWMLDYPAGIPDGLGGFTYPEAAPVYAGSQSGPQLQEIGQGTGVYAVTVMPLPPEVSAMIQFPSQGGQATPPSPIYCQVPVELIPSAAGARDQYFLAPPPNPDDAARAEQWARSAGIPFLPTIACTADLLVAPSYGGGNAYSANVSAQITYPANGGTVSGPFQVLGTATFTNDVVRFYKIEIMGGQWSNWVTVGTTHEAPVLNGVLEQLPALPPGQYQLRLWLQSAINDDPALQPYTISFTAQ
jgi:hypothetical protein